MTHEQAERVSGEFGPLATSVDETVAEATQSDMTDADAGLMHVTAETEPAEAEAAATEAVPSQEPGGAREEMPVSLTARLFAGMVRRGIEESVARLPLSELSDRLTRMGRSISSVAADRQLVMMRSTILHHQAQSEIESQRRSTREAQRERDDAELALSFRELPRMVRWMAGKPLDHHRTINRLPQQKDELKSILGELKHKESAAFTQSRYRLSQLIEELEKAEIEYQQELEQKSRDIEMYTALLHECEEAAHLRAELLLGFAAAGEICEDVLRAGGPLPPATASPAERRAYASDLEQLERQHERLVVHISAGDHDIEIDLRDHHNTPTQQVRGGMSLASGFDFRRTLI